MLELVLSFKRRGTRGRFGGRRKRGFNRCVCHGICSLQRWLREVVLRHVNEKEWHSLRVEYSNAFAQVPSGIGLFSVVLVVKLDCVNSKSC